MTKLDFEKKVLTRSKGGYIPHINYGKQFKMYFFPYFSGLWNSLPPNIQYKNIEDFKIYTKEELKPAKFKHFSRGSNIGNALLTRIRVGRSYLNEHKFTIGLSDNPECLCHFRSESPMHYFLDCFLYLPERQTLLTLIEHYIPKFSSLSKTKKMDIILRGLNFDNPDFLSLNTTLTKAVKNFILTTKRFTLTE